MHRIVLIDGIVDKDELIHPERIGDIIIPSGLKPTSIDRSHATTIAKILENLTDNYLLDNYAFLLLDNTANIQHFMQGLECCIEKKPDIVIISSGSAQPVDGMNMYPLIRLLRCKGCVIFVAQSNNCMLTFPASFSEGITVQRDYSKSLQPYSFYIEKKHPLGVDITINCKKTLEEMSIGFRNSFATPVVAALYCNAPNSEKKMEHMYRQSEALGGNAWDIIRSRIKEGMDTCHVCICSDEMNLSFSNQVLQELNYKMKVQCIGVCSEYEHISFPCWMRINISSNLSRQVAFYETFCTCELLLFHIPLNLLSKVVSEVNMDILIRIGKRGIMVWKTENFVKRVLSKSVSQTVKKIYELLT